MIQTPITELVQTVRRNCDIADANGAAIFSICGMALRLRDLNKWEKGLLPWQENDPKELIDWIDRKERVWEAAAGQAFLPLVLDGESFDPFDTPAINAILMPRGLFYGAGYAHSLKPTFFLARIQDSLKEKGFQVQVLGEELARDLMTLPALNQDQEVVFRTAAARLFLWDQMAYLKKSGQPFLKFALERCGLSDPGLESRKARFDTLLAVQTQVFIYHEIGELADQVFDRNLFRAILSIFPHTPVELLARSVRDLLADTGPKGSLAHIIQTRDEAALGFYAAFQDGLFRPLFPELRRAVDTFRVSGDWELIQRTRAQGFRTARRYAQHIMEIYTRHRASGNMETAAEQIDRVLVRPLVDSGSAGKQTGQPV